MFENKVVFVAGASGNLGQAVVRAFNEKGAAIALMDRSEERLSSLFPDVLKNANHMLVPCGDMANPEIFEKCVAAVIQRYGRIDVFVTVVGGYRAGTPLHETDLSTLDFMMMLNARTLFVGSKAIIPSMLANGYGKIVAVGARPGLSGNKNMAAYSASKGAALRLVESMALELKTKGINVNAVIPGTMDTPQNRSAMPDANYDKWVKVESVADVILFLASDAARDVTGAAVPVYGRS